jgi:nitrilase
VFLDRDATVEKAAGLIGEAAEAGADVIGFPEGFIPGHPGWVEVLPPDGLALDLSKRLFQNAVEIPSAATSAVADACAAGEIAAVVGLCERMPRTTGTLFNTQLFVDRSGRVLEKHQKFVPTVGERLVHGPGTTGSVNALELDEEVTVSGLICGENSNPLAQYATACAYPTVHVASWPQHFSPELPMQPVIELASRGLAYSLKVFVINAVTAIGEGMIDAYGDERTTPFLRSDEARGRASIVAPSGDILAEADGFGEQLVLADVDPSDVIIPKFVHDTAGHYNRPELFSHLFPHGRE